MTINYTTQELGINKPTRIIVFNWHGINRVTNLNWNETDFVCTDSAVAIFRIKWK